MIWPSLLRSGTVCQLHSIRWAARRKLSSTAPAFSASKSTPPKLRFAPSPTGELHLGGLRTALFNHLFARKFNGKWILRIEDTDRTRLVPQSATNIRRWLNWAQLKYDEEPTSEGGKKRFIVQSDRLDVYKEHAEILIKKGKAYRDFREKVEEESDQKKPATRSPKLRDYVPPDEEEAQKLLAQGKRCTVRLKMDPVDWTLQDLVFGKVDFPADSRAEDPILLKSSGWPTYHLASVVDDHDLGITHVLRGEEWLPSVPRHLALYEAFGWTPPTFAHLPLLINADGSKLSKRFKGNQVDVLVRDFIDKGYEPEALINFVALMGYNHHHEAEGRNKLSPDEEKNSEVMTMDRLIEGFDPSRISATRAEVDVGKLRFLNKRHINLKVTGSEESLQRLVHRVKPAFKELYSHHSRSDDEDYIGQIITCLNGRFHFVHDIPAAASYFFNAPDPLKVVGCRARAKLMMVREDPQMSAIIDMTKEAVEDLSAKRKYDEERLQALMKDITRKLLTMFPPSRSDKEKSTQGEIFWKMATALRQSLRKILANGMAGPDIPTIMLTLGPKETMRRLHNVSPP